MCLDGKRLLLLGGSSWKDAMKDFANTLGVTLIATGNNKSAGIFDIADEGYQIDSTDADAMKKLIISKNIDGVYMGGSEAVISSASDYLRELDMPCYCTKEQWNFIQNKLKLKKLLREFSLPTVYSYDILYEDIDKNAERFNFPVVTKPADSCGGTGFSVCTNTEEIKEGYLLAAEKSTSNEVIVEDFVENNSIVVFYTFSEGKMIFSGIEDKYPMQYAKKGSFVAGMHVFNSSMEQKFREKFDEKLALMFSSIGIKEGSIWLEVFVSGDNYYFNEAGYRYSGSVTVYPIDYFYGINQVASDMYYALTGKSIVKGWNSLIPENITHKKHYCLYPVYLNAGTIKSVNGVCEVEKLPDVVKVFVTKSEGCIVHRTGDFSQNFGFVHFVFDTKCEFKETIRKIDSLLSIKNTNDEDMRIILSDEFLDRILV